MKLKPVLIASAMYLGLVGLGVMFAPRYFGIGAVPPDAPPALIAFLRIFAGPCLGIAVLNWMARDAEPSPARNAIVLANIVGFGCVTAKTYWEFSAATPDSSPRGFSWCICCSRSRSSWHGRATTRQTAGGRP